MIETGGGLAAVALLVFLNGFFVAAEFALVTVRRTRVQQLLEERRPGSAHVGDAVGHLDSYIAACQLGITLASLALGWIGEPALADLLDPLFGAVGAHALAVAAAFAVLTALHVVAGELAPKGVALQYPERVALLVAGPLRLFRLVFRPVIWLLNESGWLVARALRVSRDAGSHGLGADELRLVVQASAEAGELNDQQRFMLERVIHFAGVTAGHVMTPRAEVIAIDAAVSTSEAIAFAKERRHSRYPVYRDGLDNVIGVLHARDLLLADGGAPLTSLLREPLVAPAQAHLQELLRLMRSRRTQFAIVLDEYGGVDGIVTLEDVLEEIVGELQDEFEAPQEAAVRRPGGIVRIDAHESVDALGDLLGIEAPPGPYHTVAGFVLDLLGDIPEEGATADFGGYRFTVVEMDGLRIAAIEARRVASAPAAPPPAPPAAENSAGDEARD